LSGLIVGWPGDYYVSRGEPGQQVAIFYALRPGTRRLRAQGWCLDFDIAVPQDPRRALVCNGTFNGSGNFSCVRPIPGAASGRRVLLQAAQRGTCPQACMSNVVVELID